MHRRRSVSLFLLSLFAWTGCGTETKTPVTTPEPQAQPVPAQAESAQAVSPAELEPTATLAELNVDTSQPQQAVTAFLTALQESDDVAARLILTDKARHETEVNNMAVSPPGSNTAKFAVGNVNYTADNQVAQVASTWDDVGPQGTPFRYDIVWVLRNEPSGWRIAGLQTSLYEGGPLQFLNFENIEELERQKQIAAEMAERASADQPIRQAQQPSSQPPR